MNPLARAATRVQAALDVLGLLADDKRRGVVARWLDIIVGDAPRARVTLALALDLGEITLRVAGVGETARGVDGFLTGAAPADQPLIGRARATGATLGAWLRLDPGGIDGGWQADGAIEPAVAIAFAADSPTRGVLADWVAARALRVTRIERSLGAGTPYTELTVVPRTGGVFADAFTLPAALGVDGYGADVEAMLATSAIAASVRLLEGGLARVGVGVDRPPVRRVVELCSLLGLPETADRAIANAEGVLGVQGARAAQIYRGDGGLAAEVSYEVQPDGA